MSDTGAITGSVVELYMNNQLIGVGVSARMEEPTQLVRVDTLGRKHSREILEDGVAPRMSAECVYMDAEELARFGVVGNGQRTAVPMPGVQAVLYDMEHSRSISRMEGLKCSMRVIEVNKGRAVMTNATWEGTIMTVGGNLEP